MPQHKSAAKRVRQNERRRLQNRLHSSRARTLIKKLRETTDPSEASSLLDTVKAALDRMVSKGIIHKNKAANYKSDLEHYVNSLG